ncbi:MAG: Na(+)-translocating NADH-quinone reductase subunit A, partial [Pseudomonadales bacterium]|nr:Na(+)-translocating NADH-quinone reductase subunit A [Pseudomonadales bacterium]
MINIQQGLDLPISGEPEQSISQGTRIRSVGLVGFDYVGMKPTMFVKEGDIVKLGQALFEDKKNPGVIFTSPASGKIAAINRGEKRVLQSVVIDVDDSMSDAESFDCFPAEKLDSLERDTVQRNLLRSGLWTAFRTRPYSKCPAPQSVPHSIFVTAIDTNPLSANPVTVISERSSDFSNGLKVLARLTEGKVFVCKSPDASFDLPVSSQIVSQAFSGPHPAGLPGTHIHFLDPVSVNKTVWHINYQDVIAIGSLFVSGSLNVERVISLAGPSVSKPRLLRTRLGANLDELCAGELSGADNRVISGSVLSGRKTHTATAYLGRYHLQVTVLEEGSKRQFMGWMSPGINRHSVLGIYLSGFFMKGKKFRMNTSTNGSDRAMVPVGSYERVMPLDILPTQLLRALIVGDTGMAQQLGCL